MLQSQNQNVEQIVAQEPEQRIIEKQLAETVEAIENGDYLESSIQDPQDLREDIIQTAIDQLGMTREEVLVALAKEGTSTKSKRSILNLIYQEFKSDLEEKYPNLGKIPGYLSVVPFKAITYPIIGNMSSKLTEDLENRIGSNWYNASNAFATNLITNIFTYCASGGLIAYALEEDPVLGVGYGCGVGCIEAIGRIISGIFKGNDVVSESEPVPSLIGKIISLPFEAKQYLVELYKRAKEKI